MSQFIVTDIGLNAAVNAAQNSISVVLKSFAVGSDYGYTPVRSDTGLHGTTLYTDQITSSRQASDGSLVLTCSMSTEAGPFDFGEIGVFTNDGKLFCLAALDTPLTKYSSLGTNIATTYTFDVYVKVAESTAVITVDSVTTVTGPQIISALGYTPYNSTNPAGYITQGNAIQPGADASLANVQFNSIGVGMAPSYSAGNIRCTGNVQYFPPSDIKFKENLKVIQNPLAILLGIRGYTMEWTDEFIESQGGEDEFTRKQDVSLVAQEVQAKYPWPVRDKSDGSLGLDYTRMIPLLVECVHSLMAENDDLRERLDRHDSRITCVERDAAPFRRIGGA